MGIDWIIDHLRRRFEFFIFQLEGIRVQLVDEDVIGLANDLL
jgi:hypothetical protein